MEKNPYQGQFLRPTILETPLMDHFLVRFIPQNKIIATIINYY